MGFLTVRSPRCHNLTRASARYARYGGRPAMATIPTDVPRGATRARKTGSRKPTPRVQAASRGPNWGRLVAEGRAARGAADTGRWRIGQLASLVAKQYGARSLQAFADDIGESYSTVRRYRWVYTRYEPTVRF